MWYSGYKIWTVCLATIGIMSSVYLLSRQDVYMSMNGMKSNFQLDDKRHEALQHTADNNTPVHNPNAYSVMHNERIRNLKEVCSRQDLFHTRTYRGHTKTFFYISNKYDFSYCKVPKSGCTFWTQVFLILANQDPKDVFGLKRSAVHGTPRSFFSSFAEIKYRNPRMVLVSRDPYSRLYSAFIDKSYLGLYPTLRTSITGIRGSTCNFNGTFEGFLQYAITEARSNRTLNRHWAPIFSLCQPCDVNQWRLVKQETFSKDVEFILKELNIEEDKYKVISDALHDHRAEVTVPGIVETVYMVNKKQPIVESCIGGVGVARRMWKSFQIQGFIDERVKFPEEKFATQAQYWNNTLVSELILNTIRDNPMTSLESKQQRYRALVSAYETVSQETVEGIQDVFKQDFALYGYDTKPPVMNEEGLPKGY